MNDIDPHTKDTILQPGLLTYLGVVGLSIWGGITSFLESKEPFSWRNFVAHLASSSFAGMLAGFACQYANISGAASWIVVGVASHMGTPAIVRLAMKMRLIRSLLGDTEKERNE